MVTIGRKIFILTGRVSLTQVLLVHFQGRDGFGGGSSVAPPLAVCVNPYKPVRVRISTDLCCVMCIPLKYILAGERCFVSRMAIWWGIMQSVALRETCSGASQ